MLGCQSNAGTPPQQADTPAQTDPPALPTAVTTPTGTPIGEPSTVMIGADGGTLDSPDSRLTLTIPAGALESDTEITIQPISGESPGAIGGGFRLGPDGTEFAKPVTLTFTYSDDDLEGTVAEALGGAYQSSDDSWYWLEPSLDVSAKSVSVSTDHFSDYALVKGFNLRPSRGSVEPNDTLALSVVYCFAASIPGADEELATLGGLDCRDTVAANGDDLAPLLKSSTVKQWYVNGVVGGSATNGTITGSGASATYKAPSKAPSGGKVSVSGRMSYNKAEGGSVLLVSEVTIGPKLFSKYEGTLSASATLLKGENTLTGVTATLQTSLPLRNGGTHIANYETPSDSPAIGQVSGIELDIADSIFPKHCTQADSITVSGSAAIGFDFDNKVYTVFGAASGGGTFHCVYSGGENAGSQADDTFEVIDLDFGSRGPNDSGTCPPAIWFTPQERLEYKDVAHVSGDCTIITQLASPGPSTTFNSSWDLKGVE